MMFPTWPKITYVKFVFYNLHPFTQNINMVFMCEEWPFKVLCIKILWSGVTCKILLLLQALLFHLSLKLLYEEVVVKCNKFTKHWLLVRKTFKQGLKNIR